MSKEKSQPKSYANPYLSGVLIGLTLLASFLILGAGLGASSGLARIGAFFEGLFFYEHTFSGEYFSKWGKAPLDYYLVFMLAGIFLGGLFSAFTNKRIVFSIERGASANKWMRLTFSAFGGILAGFASRLVGGCTSGQALTGGSLLLTGSLIFLCCIFIGGFAISGFVRRQWDD